MQHLDQVYGKLSELHISLAFCDQYSLTDDAERPITEATTVRELREIARICSKDCNSLLKLVKELKAGSGNNRPRWWTSFSKAMVEVWRSDD